MGAPGVIKFPLGPPGVKKKSPWGPWAPGLKFQHVHVFFDQGGLGGAEHLPARYKVKGKI